MASLRAQLSQERDLGSEGASYEHCESLLETLLSLMQEERIPEVVDHESICHLIVKAWKTGHRDDCTALTHRWIAHLKTLVGDDLDVKAKLAMLFHELNG